MGTPPKARGQLRTLDEGADFRIATCRFGPDIWDRGKAADPEESLRHMNLRSVLAPANCRWAIVRSVGAVDLASRQACQLTMTVPSRCLWA